jgi:hypothetical protein
MYTMYLDQIHPAPWPFLVTQYMLNDWWVTEEISEETPRIKWKCSKRELYVVYEYLLLFEESQTII